MTELFQLFDRLLEFLGWTGGGALLLVLALFSCVWVVKDGFGGVFFRLGRAVKEVRVGPHFRPWPIYQMNREFCNDQNELLPRGQIVTTKDGIPCRVEGSLSFRVVDLWKRETVVDDPDKQIPQEAMAEIRDWALAHIYKQCRMTLSGKEIIPETIQRARAWGIEIEKINISTFEPADAEARALVFYNELARRKIRALRYFAKAVDQVVKDYPALRSNTSLLLAAMIGTPLNAVSQPDQLSVIKEGIEAVQEKLAQEEGPEPSVLKMAGEELLGSVPGGQILLQILGRSNGESS